MSGPLSEMIVPAGDASTNLARRSIFFTWQMRMSTTSLYVIDEVPVLAVQMIGGFD
jgi:hypothetical protein